MGEVYRALDTMLGRQVALKVLPPSLAHDPGRSDRFRREARTVASLDHPHIVTIHSVEQDSGSGAHFLRWNWWKANRWIGGCCDLERGLDLLERSNFGFHPYEYMAHHCRFLDPVRDTPRFQALLAQAKERTEAFRKAEG